jgi:diguanylate cyclase (GGDEF)-like protein
MNTIPPFRHVLIIEDEKARRIIALEESTYSLGRESNNDIIIYDRVVSRHHATLVRIRQSPRLDNYAYRMIDGDLEGHRSTNGLIVNGQLQETHDLKHGDVIVFGTVAKASYYILSTSLDIALFNPLDSSQLAVIELPETQPNDENSKSTLITDEDLSKRDQKDLIRLASFPELSPNPIIEIDFDGNLTYLNPAASIKFNTLPQDKVDHPILAGLLTCGQNTEGNLLLREVNVNADIYEQYVHYLADSQLIRSYLFDVTERKKAEAQLQHQAFFDTLTELPNRIWFNQQLTQALHQASRQDTLMAVMFLDLDCFKNINDTLGHSVGDRILQAFAGRLASCVRAGDVIARWGGDEFTLLLPHIQAAEDTINLAQRILNTLKSPFDFAGHQLYIKTSIGIAIYPQDGQDGETLLKNADAALYRAKERGRNHYRFYSSTMTSQASLLLNLENFLRIAIEKNELQLDYQPQIKLKTSKVSGMEALLRWYHPELGHVSPVKLIPLAEKTDLALPISEWVLKTACRQCKTWQKEGLGTIPVAVNLSPRQFLQTELVDMLSQILTDCQLEPQLLELEITEHTLMQNLDLARSQLEQLQKLGVRLSMDDFGTGYSSLSYLQKLPFNTIKIDQSFVHALQDNPQDMAIISAIIAVGRSFQLRVIAEGVETLQQLELLQRLNCEEVQGDWFSRPLKAEDTHLFLAQGV